MSEDMVRSEQVLPRQTKLSVPSPSGMKVEWLSDGRTAKCAPNPAYPEGVDVDAAEGRTGCTVALPYPAPSCGMWFVECPVCGHTTLVTAAGRPDDPRSVRVPCKIQGAA